jgi:hypothetical protein
VLARDRLAGALTAVLVRDYAHQVALHYRHTLVDAAWAEDDVTLTFATATEVHEKGQAKGSEGSARASAAAAAVVGAASAAAAAAAAAAAPPCTVVAVVAPFVVGADGAARRVADMLAALERRGPGARPVGGGGERRVPGAAARLAGRAGSNLARAVGLHRPLRVVRYTLKRGWEKAPPSPSLPPSCDFAKSA